ncbi:MAG: shikimate kinase [Bacteroidales bacterium]|nr:shikimate kinase [Bacteroidales bacterium]
MKRENPRCFSIVGLPCSGKTSFGRLLSSAKEWDLIDLDEEISRREGCSVQEYISRAGLTAFREKETALLREILDTIYNKGTKPMNSDLQASCSENNGSKPIVISTGGGIVLSPENRELLKSKTTVIYLCRPLEDIQEDISDEELEKRPILRSYSLDELYDERHSLYEEVADILISDPFGPFGLEKLEKY